MHPPELCLVHKYSTGKEIFETDARLPLLFDGDFHSGCQRERFDCARANFLIVTRRVHVEAKFDPTRCAESVANGGRDVRSHQCQRKAVVQEDGHGWCRVHAPSEQRRRQAASAARFHEQMARLSAPGIASVRLGALQGAAGTTNQDDLVLLILAGKRWLNNHGACPQHGLTDGTHRCRDYDGEMFGPEGYAPQGWDAARPFFPELQPHA